MTPAELAEVRDFLTAIHEVLNLPPADPADDRADTRREWELSTRVAAVLGAVEYALRHPDDPGLRHVTPSLRRVNAEPVPYAVEHQDPEAEAAS